MYNKEEYYFAIVREERTVILWTAILRLIPPRDKRTIRSTLIGSPCTYSLPKSDRGAFSCLCASLLDRDRRYTLWQKK